MEQGKSRGDRRPVKIQAISEQPGDGDQRGREPPVSQHLPRRDHPRRQGAPAGGRLLDAQLASEVGEARLHEEGIGHEAHELRQDDVARVPPEDVDEDDARHRLPRGTEPREARLRVEPCAAVEHDDVARQLVVAPGTVKAHTASIYRKLDVPGSGELLASLLSLSLKMLAKGERIEPRPVTPAQPTQNTAAVVAR